MSAIDHPAALFIELYLQAAQWTPTRRYAACECTPSQQTQINDTLAQDDAAHAAQGLRALLDAAANADQRDSIVLAVMRSIDRCFQRIHPRYPRVPTPAVMPSWLTDADENRDLSAAYHATAERRLIPRGPLCRGARGLHASSADRLADWFPALAVVKPYLKHDDRTILVEHSVETDVLRPPGAAGEERVGFLAVTQTADELQVSLSAVNGRSFIDFTAAPGLDIPARMVEGLAQLTAQTHIVLAPELVVDASAVNKLQDLLQTARITHGLLLAGSGHSGNDPTEQNRQWNEAVVLDATGRRLWSQRKLWPALMDSGRVACIADPAHAHAHAHHQENNASGSALAITDVQGYGRCAILICQDVQAQTLTTSLLQDFQPDWIFAPIMDSGADIGRWSHQASYALSGLSRARFLVCTNSAYARIAGDPKDINLALAIGPSTRGDGDPLARACAQLPVEVRAGIELAEVQFGSGCSKWEQTQLGIRDPRPK